MGPQSGRTPHLGQNLFTTGRTESDRSELTEFWSFTQHEGVGPELADGSVVEALITDGASEAAAAQDVEHVGTSPDRPDDAETKTKGR